MKKYNLEDIYNRLEEAEDAAGLKEWYYPEVIAKLLFNDALDKSMKKSQKRGKE